MKTILKTSILFIVFLFYQNANAFTERRKPEDFGYWYLNTIYRKDTVNLVVVSKKGDERKKKPIIVIERGSSPTPLVITDINGFSPIVPFDTKTFTEEYHLVFISKPGIPARCNVKKLNSRMEYLDPKTGAVPLDYSWNNHIDFYVSRDAQVLKFLKKQPWVDKNKIVLAGHSEGGTIMAKLATVSGLATHVISSSQNPFGQMATILNSIREFEDPSGFYANQQFDYWEKLVNKSVEVPKSPNAPTDAYYKYVYGFSLPAIDYFKKIKVPVLVCYGTKDNCAPFNDYMHITMIRDKKKNFTFNSYFGLEQNYYAINKNGELIKDNANWNKVAQDWKAWLDKN